MSKKAIWPSEQPKGSLRFRLATARRAVGACGKGGPPKKWPSMRWTLTTGVAPNLYERLGTRLAANLMHGILLLEAIQGAIKTKVTSRAPFNAQAFAINPPPKKKASTPPRGGLDALVIRLGRHHCSTYTSTSNPPRGGGKAGMQHHHMIGQPSFC